MCAWNAEQRCFSALFEVIGGCIDEYSPATRLSGATFVRRRRDAVDARRSLRHRSAGAARRQHGPALDERPPLGRGPRYPRLPPALGFHRPDQRNPLLSRNRSQPARCTGERTARRQGGSLGPVVGGRSASRLGTDREGPEPRSRSRTDRRLARKRNGSGGSGAALHRDLTPIRAVGIGDRRRGGNGPAPTASNVADRLRIRPEDLGARPANAARPGRRPEGNGPGGRRGGVRVRGSGASDARNPAVGGNAAESSARYPSG